MACWAQRCWASSRRCVLLRTQSPALMLQRQFCKSQSGRKHSHFVQISLSGERRNCCAAALPIVAPLLWLAGSASSPAPSCRHETAMTNPRIRSFMTFRALSHTSTTLPSRASPREQGVAEHCSCFGVWLRSTQDWLPGLPPSSPKHVDHCCYHSCEASPLSGPKTPYT